MELENKTGLSAELFPAIDADGRTYIVLVVRGTFDIRTDGDVEIAEEQDPVCVTDEYRGEPESSSLVSEADLALRKIGTDIIMLGKVYAPENRSAKAVIVELAVGQISKRVIVFGDRVWTRRYGVLKISSPAPFLEMPLIYERAFGGTDANHKDPSKCGWEPRNPVGVGFFLNKPSGLPVLPNIEDLQNLIRSPTDRPIPQGFGFIARTWMPRSQFAGTYDEKWQKERSPLLPLDFDSRYYQSAHPDFICRPHLQGDEEISVVGVVRKGRMTLKLPGIALGVGVHRLHGSPQRKVALLDTVIVRPNEYKLNLVWRCPVLCPRKVFDIERIVAFRVRLDTAKAILGEKQL